MEQSETQLHDVKKLNPVSLKLKFSRLEELEEFFKLSEAVGKEFEVELEQSIWMDCGQKSEIHCDYGSELNCERKSEQRLHASDRAAGFSQTLLNCKPRSTESEQTTGIDYIPVNANNINVDAPIEDSDDDFFAEYE